MKGHFKDKDAASNAGKKSSRRGSPNKSTKELRNSFQFFVENNVPKFQEWIEEVAKNNPAKAIELVTSLGEYIMPKLSRTEIEADIKSEVKTEIDYSKLNESTLKDIIKQLRDKRD
tara:strand:+ start:208 stop:555 length:348 start_codon:yes stop_codon:yes gene_type:complete